MLLVKKKNPKKSCQESGSMVWRRLVRDKVQKGKAMLYKFLHGVDPPLWYRSQSLFQWKAADELMNALRDDGDQKTAHRTRKCLLGIGICPIVDDKCLQLIMTLSRLNDIAFLWFLMEMYYKTPGKGYSINEQLIMSTISHLDMITTMRELDRILPKPITSDAKKEPDRPHWAAATVPARAKGLPKMPYFQNLPVPVLYGSSLRSDEPKFRVKINNYDVYKDPTYVVLNESNRWYANYKLRTSNRIANQIIYEEVQNLFDKLNSTSSKSQIVQTLCAHHLVIDAIEKSFEQELQVIAKQRCINYLTGMEKRKMATRRRVMEQLESDVGAYISEFRRQTDRTRRTSVMKILSKQNIRDMEDVLHDEPCDELSPHRRPGGVRHDDNKSRLDVTRFVERKSQSDTDWPRSHDSTYNIRPAYTSHINIGKFTRRRCSCSNNCRMYYTNRNYYRNKRYFRGDYGGSGGDHAQFKVHNPPTRESTAAERKKYPKRLSEVDLMDKQPPSGFQNSVRQFSMDLDFDTHRRVGDKAMRTTSVTRSSIFALLAKARGSIMQHVDSLFIEPPATTKPKIAKQKPRRKFKIRSELLAPPTDPANPESVKRFSMGVDSYMRDVQETNKPRTRNKQASVGHSLNSAAHTAAATKPAARKPLLQKPESSPGTAPYSPRTPNGKAAYEHIESKHADQGHHTEETHHRTLDSLRPSENFFTAPEHHKPYMFNYRNIFQFDKCTPQNLSIKRTFIDSIDHDIRLLNRLQNSDVDLSLAVDTDFKRLWKDALAKRKFDVDLTNKSEHQLKGNTIFAYPRQYYDPNDKPLMLKMLKDALEHMSNNPKFVLASMPESYKIPVLVEWISSRYGRVYTKEERLLDFRKSLGIMKALNSGLLDLQLPRPIADLDSTHSLLDYSWRDHILRKAKRTRRIYDKSLDRSLMRQARIFWFAMRPYLCTGGSPRDTFFAYMPSRVSEILRFRSWRPNEHKPAFTIWSNMMAGRS